MPTAQEYTSEQFIADSLIPYNQALLFKYAASTEKAVLEEPYLRLLKETLASYKRSNFLPLVDDDYIDRLEKYVKLFLGQPGLQTRFPIEVCRMVAELHLPGVVHFAEARLLEAFGEKVATA